MRTMQTRMWICCIAGQASCVREHFDATTWLVTISFQFIFKSHFVRASERKHLYSCQTQQSYPIESSCVSIQLKHKFSMKFLGKLKLFYYLHIHLPTIYSTNYRIGNDLLRASRAWANEWESCSSFWNFDYMHQFTKSSYPQMFTNHLILSNI